MTGDTTAITTVLGQRLTLTAAGAGFQGDWAGRFFHRDGRSFVAFELGLRGTAANHVEYAMDSGAVVERWAANGGTFLVGHDAATLNSVAAWSGPFHDLYSWFQGAPPSPSQVQARFGVLTFRDTPEGLVVSPRNTRSGRIVNQEYLTGLGDDALLTLHDAASFGALAPTTQGAKVRHGEVWKRAVTGADGKSGHVYLHATTSAISLYYPSGGRAAASARDLAILEDLDVRWER